MAIKKKTAGTTAPAPAKGTRGVFQVNLSTEEKALIARGAELSGLELSTFMRSESIKAARRLTGEAGSAA